MQKAEMIIVSGKKRRHKIILSYTQLLSICDKNVTETKYSIHSLLVRENFDEQFLSHYIKCQVEWQINYL